MDIPLEKIAVAPRISIRKFIRDYKNLPELCVIEFPNGTLRCVFNLNYSAVNLTSLCSQPDITMTALRPQEREEKESTKEKEEKEIKDLKALYKTTTTPNAERRVRVGPPRALFQKPSIEDIRAFCLSRRNAVDPEKFYFHYEANGWKVGRLPMKNWRAAVRYWERSGLNDSTPGVSKNGQPASKDVFDRIFDDAKLG